MLLKPLGHWRITLNCATTSVSFYMRWLASAPVSPSSVRCPLPLSQRLLIFSGSSRRCQGPKTPRLSLISHHATASPLGSIRTFSLILFTFLRFHNSFSFLFGLIFFLLPRRPVAYGQLDHGLTDWLIDHPPIYIHFYGLTVYGRLIDSYRTFFFFTIFHDQNDVADFQQRDTAYGLCTFPTFLFNIFLFSCYNYTWPGRFTFLSFFTRLDFWYFACAWTHGPSWTLALAFFSLPYHCHDIGRSHQHLLSSLATLLACSSGTLYNQHLNTLYL